MFTWSAGFVRPFAAANRMHAWHPGERITRRSRVPQLIVTLVCVAHFIYGLYNVECVCTQTKQKHTLSLSSAAAAGVQARRASCLRMSVARTRTRGHALTHARRYDCLDRGWRIRCSNGGVGGGGACNENICAQRRRHWRARADNVRMYRDQNINSITPYHISRIITYTNQ